MPGKKITGPRPPEWWLEPEPVDLKVEHVGKVNAFPGEYLVGFRINGENFTGFFPTDFVSQERKVLSALIVADVEDGWLVRIPAETFQGGPQVVIPHSEKESLITHNRENVQ